MVHLRGCEPVINVKKYFICACIVTMFIDISQGQGNLLLLLLLLLLLCLYSHTLL